MLQRNIELNTRGLVELMAQIEARQASGHLYEIIQ
jgi:hypothetical protein